MPPENLPETLETSMWKLYLDFEEELQNRKIFDPMADIFRAVPAAPDPQAPPQQEPVIQPAGQQAPPQKMGLPPQLIPPGTTANMDLTLALVESVRLSSRFRQQKRLVVVGTGNMGEPLLREEILDQGWQSTPAP